MTTDAGGDTAQETATTGNDAADVPANAADGGTPDDADAADNTDASDDAVADAVAAPPETNPDITDDADAPDAGPSEPGPEIGPVPEFPPEAPDASPDMASETPPDVGPETIIDAPPDAGTDADTGEVAPTVDNGDWLQPPAGAVADLPPMGWNSWNTLGCNVGEVGVRAAADALVASGMRDVGYRYVNIDDCWQTGRGADGVIVADPDQFPSGMKALADYVHSKGLKLGIYSDRGTTTCQGRPGSQSYETKDAKTYAAWGIDFVKYDDCNSTMNQQTQYTAMSTAIAATGQPMVLSLTGGFAEFMPRIANQWLFSGGIDDRWDDVMANLDGDALLGAYAAPSGWNDADVLQVGNGSMTTAEYRAHFSLWSILASPLIAGTDLTNMSADTKTILTNAEVIAVDQDPLGYQGYRAIIENNLEIWVRPLQGAGNRAVVLFNRTDTSQIMSFKWTDVGLASGAASVRDLWAHQDRGSVQNQFAATVPSHDVVMLKIAGQEPAPPRGSVFLSDMIWTYAANGWGPAERDHSNGEMPQGDGRTLSVAGHQYAKGIGAHGGSMLRFHLGGNCTRFRSDIGVDDEVSSFSTIIFEVLVDGVSRFKSGVMQPGGMASVDVDVTGGRELKLRVTNAGDGSNSDHADWANAHLDCAP